MNEPKPVPQDDPSRTTDLRSPGNPAETTDLPASPALDTDIRPASGGGPDTGRRVDTSMYTDHPELMGAYNPNAPTASFDSSRTGAYFSVDEPERDEKRKTSGPPIPGYEILGELGRGGMGVVWKARQVKLNRTVALKMILTGPHASAGTVARFEAEGRAVARFQHPNIVQIFEVGEFEGMPYFSLEFVDGGPLSKKIAGEPQSPRFAAQITETLARAMQYAHERDVIHRDLKPANVLLANDGTPKITDFGLAKELKEDSGQTHSGQVLGTPSYMAPEQAEGRSDVGPLADVYALGAMLYDLLTGRPPFAGSSVLDTLVMVRTREPVAPGQLAGNIPRDVETICLKCLHKDPARRYASAGELADDLRRFLDGRPIVARPVGRVERAWRWAKREPWGAAAVVFLILAAVTGATFAVVFDRQKREAVDLAEKEKQARAAEERAKIEAKENEQKALHWYGEGRKVRDAAVLASRGVLTEIDDYMRNRAGFARVRKKIIDIAAENLNRLRGTLGPNPLEERSDGIIYTRMAELLFQGYKVQAAGELYDRTHAIFTKVRQQNPNDPVAVRDLAAVTNLRGNIALRLGDTERARELYTEALKLREKWVKMLDDRPLADEPQERSRQLVARAESKRSLGQSLTLIGGTNLVLGEPEEAARNYQDADAVFAAYPAKYPRAGEVVLERAQAQDRLGDAKFSLGDFDGADKQYLAALAMRGKNVGAAAAARMNYGDFLLSGKKDAAAAAAEYRKAFDNFAARLAADPENLDLQRVVAAAHYRLGVVAQNLTANSTFGRLAGSVIAADHFEQSRKIRAELGSIDNRDTQGLIDWMVVLGRCGKAADARTLSWFLLKQARKDRRVLFQTACGLAVASAGASDPALAESCRERAFRVLDDLIANGWKDRVALDTDPDLASLRTDSRFEKLLDRIPARSNR